MSKKGFENLASLPHQRKIPTRARPEGTDRSPRNLQG